MHPWSIKLNASVNQGLFFLLGGFKQVETVLSVQNSYKGALEHTGTPVKKKRESRASKYSSISRRIRSSCFEWAMALPWAIAAEKETALGLEFGLCTNTAIQFEGLSVTFRLPPLCFARRRPLGRCGSLVLTRTGLSVSPRASLSSPALPPASHSSGFPSPGSLFRCLLHSHCHIYLARRFSNLLPIPSFGDNVQNYQFKKKNKNPISLCLPPALPVSLTRINTLAPLRWKREFCCGTLPIITSSSHFKHVYSTPMTQTVNWCWYRAVKTFCNFFFCLFFVLQQSVLAT